MFNLWLERKGWNWLLLALNCDKDIKSLCKKEQWNKGNLVKEQKSGKVTLMLIQWNSLINITFMGQL